MIRKYSIYETFSDRIDDNDVACSTATNEEPMNTSTLDAIEYVHSQMILLKILNEVFHSLKIEPIIDAYVLYNFLKYTCLNEFSRYTVKLRERINEANIILNNLCKSLLKSEPTTVSNNTEPISFDIEG
jgi:hypothetical protein